jgi:tetratricopeptide (TPR) repeat protein
MCRRWTLPAWFPNVASSLGYVYALSGRLAEGVELLQEAVDRTAATGNMVRHSSEVAMLGEAQLLSGHLDAADTLARRALELARAHSERGNEAGALRLLGEVERCRVRPDVQVAETRYGEALRLAGECGMRPLAACCHLGLGRLYLRVGHAPGAKEHLGRAVELLGAVGMPFWLGQAEAAWREVR